jgi:hypothetical protein
MHWNIHIITMATVGNARIATSQNEECIQRDVHIYVTLIIEVNVAILMTSYVAKQLTARSMRTNRLTQYFVIVHRRNTTTGSSKCMFWLYFLFNITKLNWNEQTVSHLICEFSWVSRLHYNSIVDNSTQSASDVGVQFVLFWFKATVVSLLVLYEWRCFHLV